MSKTSPWWGHPRQFTENTNMVEAIPIVHNDTIQRVVITKMNGNRRITERVMLSVQRTYTGASYKTAWVLGGTNEA